MDRLDRRYAPLHDGSAWRGEELQNSTAWLTELSPAQILDLDDWLARLRRAGTPMEAIRRADFRLPNLEPRLEEIADAIECGRGFALLRGLPVQRWGLREPELAKRLLARGAIPAGGPRDDFTRRVLAEVAQWHEVIAAAGIHADD